MYAKKFDIFEKNKELDKNIFPLFPIINTQIYDDHKWYFLAEFELYKNNENLDFMYNMTPTNSWWHFYLNSFLLDTYLFAKDVAMEDDFKNLIEEYKNDIAKKSSISKENFFIEFSELTLSDLKRLIEDTLAEKSKNNLKDLRFMVDNVCTYAIWYIEFMIKRENYILENNPQYDWEYLRKFLINIEKQKEKYIALREDTLKKLDLQV